LGKKVGAEEEEKRIPLSKTLSEVVYWLVFLIFLPAILGALGLTGLLVPVQGMIDKFLGFLPNLLAAGVILLIGWFIARVVRMIVTNLLSAAGADSLGERIGLSGVMGKQKLSGFLGLLAYVLVIIPVIVASLNALKIDAITQPTSNMLNVILNALPSIFAAFLVLAIAYIVGRLVSRLVADLLAGIGFNNIMFRLGLGRKPVEGEEKNTTPSDVIGYVVLVSIILVAVTAASHLLGFAVLTDLMSQFLVFASHVLLGLVIFAFGLYLANLISKAIHASGSAQAGLFAVIARVAILLLAGAISLRQMGFANEIVNLAFGLLLGAVALAMAIAFGVGGREFAAKRLEEWQRSIKPKD